MNGRGEYGVGRSIRSTRGPRGRGLHAIGASPKDALKEDVASFQADLAALDDDVRSLARPLQDQIAARAAADPQLRQSPLYVFYAGKWMPFHDSWLRFRQSASGISKAGFALWTALGQLHSYRSKLSDMRVDAALAGFSVYGESPQSPQPAPTIVAPPVIMPVEAPPITAPPKSDTGVYLALGVGVVAAIAAAAIYHAGAT